MCQREIFAVFLRIFQITTVIFCKFEMTIVVLSAHLDKNKTTIGPLNLQKNYKSLQKLTVVG